MGRTENAMQGRSCQHTVSIRPRNKQYFGCCAAASMQLSGWDPLRALSVMFALHTADLFLVICTPHPTLQLTP